MKQLIDKSAVVAEIKRHIFVCDSVLLDKDSKYHDRYKERRTALENLLKFLNTLEVKEVNLEKEFDEYTQPITAQDIKDEPFTQLFACARHFFELGLKTKREFKNKEK